MCASPLQRDARPRLLFVRLYSVQTKKGGRILTKSRRGRGEGEGGGGQTQGVCSLTPAARHRPFFTLLRECMCLSIPPSNRPQMSQAGAMFPSCQLDNASEAPWMRPRWEGGRRRGGRHTGEEELSSLGPRKLYGQREEGAVGKIFINPTFGSCTLRPQEF